MNRQFGGKYKKFIDRNPNQKSIPYDNPGLEFGVLRTRNPYIDLINRWDFIPSIVTGSLAVGRGEAADIAPIYYVNNGYVDDNYVEVQFGI